MFSFEIRCFKELPHRQWKPERMTVSPTTSLSLSLYLSLSLSLSPSLLHESENHCRLFFFFFHQKQLHVLESDRSQVKSQLSSSRSREHSLVVRQQQLQNELSNQIQRKQVLERELDNVRSTLRSTKVNSRRMHICNYRNFRWRVKVNIRTLAFTSFCMLVVFCKSRIGSHTTVYVHDRRTTKLIFCTLGKRTECTKLMRTLKCLW